MNQLKVKVRNCVSVKTGRPVANQFIIEVFEDGKLNSNMFRGEYLQSYDSIIAFWEYGTGRTILDEDYWDYSRTTGKYRNSFLSSRCGLDNKKDIEKAIKDGKITLAKLN